MAIGKYGLDCIGENLKAESPHSSGQVTDLAAPTVSTDERELTKKLQSGDPEAIETLYTAYFNRLYILVFHSVRRDTAAAEDIVQDVFLSALRSAKGFKGQSRLYTWLVGIAHHKIHDYYRHERRKIYHDGDLIGEARVDLQSIADDNQPVTERLESDELGIVIAKALSVLPFDYRQALLLKYVEDMTVFEISQIMKRSPKAIDGLLTRARKILRENSISERLIK